MNNNEQTSVGQFYEISKTIDQAIQVDETTNSTSASAINQLIVLIHQLANTDSLLEMSTSLSQTQTLTQSKFALLAAFNQEQINYAAINSNYRQQCAAGFLNAKLLNQSIEVNETYEINTKMVNDIYLESMLAAESTLSAEQLQTLQQIAQQCPEEGGLAIYEARALLPDCVLTELEICEPKVEDSPKPISVTDSVTNALLRNTSATTSIYPNPTTNSFFVQLPQKSSGYMYISNLQGKEVFTTQVNSSTSQEVFPSLVAGLYFVNIQLEDGKIYTEKLIIQSH